MLFLYPLLRASAAVVMSKITVAPSYLIIPYAVAPVFGPYDHELSVQI